MPVWIIEMQSRNKWKEVDIKNRVCYYFDYIINGMKVNFSNSSLNKKLYETVSVYNISHKTPTDPKPLHNRFDKKDGCIISLDSKFKHFRRYDTIKTYW